VDRGGVVDVTVSTTVPTEVGATAGSVTVGSVNGVAENPREVVEVVRLVVSVAVKVIEFVEGTVGWVSGVLDVAGGGMVLMVTAAPQASRELLSGQHPASVQ
jgi:hypothetical protein